MAFNVLDARLNIIELINQTISDIDNDIDDYSQSIQRIDTAYEISHEIMNVGPGGMLERSLGALFIDNDGGKEYHLRLCRSDLFNALENIDDPELSTILRYASHRLNAIQDYNNRRGNHQNMDVDIPMGMEMDLK